MVRTSAVRSALTVLFGREMPILLLRDLLLLLILAGALQACTPAVESHRDTAQLVDGTPIDPTVRARSASGQMLLQTDENNRAVGEIYVARDALGDGQAVRVSRSFHTDLSELAEEFAIAANVKLIPTNVATVISSNIDANLKKPMKITLNVPKEKTIFGLVVDSHNYFVVYTVRDAQTDSWRRGVLPSNSLQYDDGRLTFSSELFGRFEVYESSIALDLDDSLRLVSKPNFDAPPVEITRVTPLVAAQGQTVTIHGKYLDIEKVTMEVSGQPVQPILGSAKGTLKFRMPAIPFGLKTIRVASKNAPDGTSSEGTAQVFSRSLQLKYPIILLKPEYVCKGLTYYDGEANVLKGTKACEQPVRCDSDGQKGCVTSPQFPAVNRASVPYDKLLVGTSFLGGQGEFVPATIPDCTEDGQTGCAATSDFKAADMNVLMPGYILHNTKIAGVTGTMQKRLADCTINGQRDCSVSNDFQAVPNGILAAKNIRKGVKVGLTLGDYPSAAHRLEEDTATADLDSASFNAKIKSTSAFEFFDSAGTRYALSGDADLTAANIKQGVSIFSTEGKLVVTPNGGDDDDDDDGGTLAPIDLRYGVTYKGVTGSLRTRCRNGARLENGNYQTGSGTAGLDVYDSITSNGMPNANPWGTKEEFICDHDTWHDTTAETGLPGNHTCKGNGNGKECIFRDKITGSSWYIRTGDSGVNFEEAVSRCSSLSYKEGKWRVPTQKEAMTAYVHGFGALEGAHSKIFITGAIWTSTISYSVGNRDGENKIMLSLRDGTSQKAGASGSALQAVCIHE